MTNLIPRDRVFQELSDFRRNVDQIFNRFLGRPLMHEESTFTNEFSPAIESFIDRDNKKFHCQVLLPGVDPKDVDVQVHGNTLTISGERSSSRETKEADYFHREISYGSFLRSLELPEGVDKDKVSAEYKNGMLEIAAPIAAASLPKKVEVKSLPASKAASA
jgi:HSP20 family protein